MLTLYSKPTCAFSRHVVATLNRLDIEFENKDIVENPVFAEELIAHGGKRQTPYLIDPAQGIALYESEDIVAHLQKHYGTPPVATRPRLHVGGSACIACEG